MKRLALIVLFISSEFSALGQDEIEGYTPIRPQSKSECLRFTLAKKEFELELLSQNLNGFKETLAETNADIDRELIIYIPPALMTVGLLATRLRGPEAFKPVVRSLFGAGVTLTAAGTVELILSYKEKAELVEEISKAEVLIKKKRFEVTELQASLSGGKLSSKDIFRISILKKYYEVELQQVAISALHEAISNQTEKMGTIIMVELPILAILASMALATREGQSFSNIVSGMATSTSGHFVVSIVANEMNQKKLLSLLGEAKEKLAKTRTELRMLLPR